MRHFVVCAHKRIKWALWQELIELSGCRQGNTILLNGTLKWHNSICCVHRGVNLFVSTVYFFVCAHKKIRCGGHVMN